MRLMVTNNAATRANNAANNAGMLKGTYIRDSGLAIAAGTCFAWLIK